MKDNNKVTADNSFTATPGSLNKNYSYKITLK